ncbi:phage portal protein [Subtercola vilae]|uniref:Phage portal protein n=1 Tax=Subtercola vilae TaxID=2056433 RepID=A0A4T2BVQ3_9MICO|nr:phage portal protein [Subtercola vilae]TIH33688.1 phage portal protein [Subtercola vilae]
MPLPISDPKAIWPPENLTPIFQHMRQWSAWYSNELATLQLAYGGGVAQDSTGFFASDQGGFKATVGRTLQRWFVGQRTLGPNRNEKLPVPIAAMICQAVSDLLYAEPPTFTVRIDTDNDGNGASASEANPTQERLNQLADDMLYGTLAQGAELGAVLGGHFLRVVWDMAVIPDRPFLDVVDADQALPEFRWGRLVAVTFWRVIAREGNTVWRHLERHELDTRGYGVIIHGLYEGEDDKLGIRVDLASRPETFALSVLTQASAVAGQVDSMSPGLCVEYIPNLGPNRLWRTDSVGRYLGRSSLDGVEHLMDQLAETLSDWMLARRSARAKVFYDKSLTSSAGPGQGAVIDLDQDVFVGVSEKISGPNVKMSDKIQVLQPTFNTAEYESTATMLIQQILQMSGFALQTFGYLPSGMRTQADTTATEIESRERRTFLMRGRVIRTAIPHLSSVLSKLLAVDRVVFGTPNVDAPIWVEFPDSVTESQLRLAQTVQTLFTGESASRIERIKIMHPDWNDDMWDAELKLQEKEFAAPTVVDPMAVPPEAPVVSGDGSAAE